MKSGLICGAALLSAALVCAGCAKAANPEAAALWQRGSALCSRNDCRDAYPFLLRAAQMGEPHAQATLGTMFSQGDGVRRDDRAAVHWYTLAAAQGHRAAEYNLGGMYLDGAGGLREDDAKGVQLYLASARQGFAPAQAGLGIAYELGIGVSPDRASAIRWLDQAAAQGDAQAQWLAGWLRQAGTPHFRTMEQLSGYIASRQQPRYTRPGTNSPYHVGNRACATPVACTTLMGQMLGKEHVP